MPSPASINILQVVIALHRERIKDISHRNVSLLSDGDVIPLGEKKHLQVIHTPGHTPGHVAFVVEEVNNTSLVY